MFDRDDALAGELFDVSLSVLLPVGDVWVVADSERSAGEDYCADVIVEAGGLDGVLVGFRGAGFLNGG